MLPSGALDAWGVMAVLSLLSRTIDEPTTFELVSDRGGTGSALAADAEVVGVGARSAPILATDFDRL